MAARVSPAKVRALLRVLGETGSYRIAAVHAKVSEAWVSKRKHGDPEFRAACEVAVTAARARLAEQQRDTTLPRHLRFLAGEEIAVQRGKNRRIVVQRAKVKQWTASAERLFLERLAATCSVTRACAAVGLSLPSAYAHRKRWPSFETRWQEALEQGYAALEFAQFETAIASLDQLPLRDDERIERISFSEACHLLDLHHRRAKRLPSPRERLAATREETNAALLKLIAGVKLSEARDREDAEAKAARAAKIEARAAAVGVKPLY